MVVRSFLIWLAIIFAEIIHGVMRAVLLVPWLGEFRSNQIGVFTGSIIIFVIAWLSVRWIGANRAIDLLSIGAIWVTLTLAFELLFGRYVIGLDWERITADYDLRPRRTDATGTAMAWDYPVGGEQTEVIESLTDCSLP